MVTSDVEGGSYELISFNPDTSVGSTEPTSSYKGHSLSAVFIARNRFAVLDKHRQVLIKNFQNEITKKLIPPHPNTEFIYFGGTSGRILLSCDDKMTLFDTQSRMVIAEVQVPRVKYVIWSHDFSHVALLSKHGINNLFLCAEYVFLMSFFGVFFVLFKICFFSVVFLFS